MEQITITGQSPGGAGVPVISAGEQDILLYNASQNEVIHLAHDRTPGPNDAHSIPLQPQSYISFDGTQRMGWLRARAHGVDVPYSWRSDILRVKYCERSICAGFQL